MARSTKYRHSNPLDSDRRESGHLFLSKVCDILWTMTLLGWIAFISVNSGGLH